MTVITFGKYRGQELTEVPTGALEHYLGWDQLREDQRQAITAELATRLDSRNTQLPLRGSSQIPADPVPEAVRRCAVDLITAGESTLLRVYPDRLDTIREAATVLRASLEPPVASASRSHAAPTRQTPAVPDVPF